MTTMLQGRVAVVTGGASGIGRATARLLAQQGAQVFVGDVQVSSPDATERSLGITYLPCDVRREADVRNLMETAVRQGGGLHTVVSNAGIDLEKQVEQVSEAEWDERLDTNLKGGFLVSKHAIGPLRAAGGGSVIFTASNAGLLPRAHDPVYSTSKAALIALAEALALCHATDKIRFNVVCPGPVSGTGSMERILAAAADRTATQKRYIEASPLAGALGRMIAPDEVAQAILYLASDAAALVTGTSIRIDGGKSLGVPPRAE